MLPTGQEFAEERRSAAPRGGDEDAPDGGGGVGRGSKATAQLGPDVGDALPPVGVADRRLAADGEPRPQLAKRRRSDLSGTRLVVPDRMNVERIEAGEGHGCGQESPESMSRHGDNKWPAGYHRQPSCCYIYSRLKLISYLSVDPSSARYIFI